MQYILNETEYQEFLALKEQNSDLSHKLEVAHSVIEKDRAQLKEIMRDIDGTSRVLKETQEISASRLTSMNNLMQEVRRLRAEHVCIAQNPKTGTVKVISVVKADTYRQFGWTVSEEYLVDRPA